MDSGWEVYSKMVLQQLEDLNTCMKELRTEISSLKGELASIKSQQNNVGELKQWKEKIDEIASPSQLKEMKKEVEELKIYKAKAVTIFAVVQFLMGFALFYDKLIN